MQPHQPLSVKVAPRTTSVVMEAGLALSELGLLITMRLARTTPVWLPRGLRAMLDNETLYRDQPQQLGGAWLPAHRRAAMLEGMAAALTPWQRAWSYGRLSSQVHWIGEAQFESALPDRGDTGMLPRFETCCAALDARREAHQSMSLTALDDCARDAVALAGALQPEPVVILTSGGDEAPPFCSFLTSAGIQAYRLPPAPAGRMLRDEGLGDALLPLVSGGQQVAALHVVAPGILSLPESWGEDEWPDGGYDDTTEAQRSHPWQGAFVLWQPMEAMA